MKIDATLRSPIVLCPRVQWNPVGGSHYPSVSECVGDLSSRPRVVDWSDPIAIGQRGDSRTVSLGIGEGVRLQPVVVIHWNSLWHLCRNSVEPLCTLWWAETA